MIPDGLYSSWWWKKQNGELWIKNVLHCRKKFEIKSVVCFHGNKSNQNSFLTFSINKWQPFSHHKHLPMEPVLNVLNQPMTHWKRPWCWEGLWAGGEGDNRGWDGWVASPTRWAWVWINSGNWWWTGGGWHAAVHGVAKSQTRLSDWTELIWTESTNDNLLQ